MEPNVSERLILSEGFESDFYKVLRKYYIEAERLEIAKRALYAPDWDQVKYLQGQADSLKQLHQQLKKIHKEEGQKEAK